MIQGTGITNSATDAYSAYKAKMASNQNNAGAGANAAKAAEKRNDEAVISSQGAEAANKSSWSEDAAKGIRDEYNRFQANLIQTMLNAAGFGNGNVNFDSIFDMNVPDNGMTAEELIELMPPEWRPDAVAERIVQFATAFYEKSGLSGEEFLAKIRDSIGAGFGEANSEIGGKLPGNIGQVIEATRNAVHQKLDAWAEAMGIQIPQPIN